MAMYRPQAFVVDDVAVLHDFIRERAFATIAVVANGEVQFAYAPVLLHAAGGRGRLQFHLARINPMVGATTGATLQFSFLGGDAYVSPDWYASEAMVPTWNYLAVEASGVARKLDRDELRQLLIDLSVEQESRLLPKPPWRIGKVPQVRVEALLNAIDGFEVSLLRLEGKFKLSQDKNAADWEGAVAGLEGRGDARSVAVANAMRRTFKAS